MFKQIGEDAVVVAVVVRLVVWDEVTVLESEDVGVVERVVEAVEETDVVAVVWPQSLYVPAS